MTQVVESIKAQANLVMGPNNSVREEVQRVDSEINNQ